MLASTTRNPRSRRPRGRTGPSGFGVRDADVDHILYRQAGAAALPSFVSRDLRAGDEAQQRERGGDDGEGRGELAPSASFCVLAAFMPETAASGSPAPSPTAATTSSSRLTASRPPCSVRRRPSGIMTRPR